VEAQVHDVEVVLANNDRVTLRVGGAFLKVDSDPSRLDVEVQAIAMAPVPTPEILWRKPSVLALAALPGPGIDELAGRLADECDWLVANGVLPADVVTRNRHFAQAVLRTWAPAFVHGDLHIEHVFIDGDTVTGIIDWSGASQGDPLYDLATLTLGHPEHLEDVVAGYGVDVDRDLVRAWWSWRCLVVIRWLSENGYGPPEHYPEVAVLQSLA
jgi:hypothetical protein